MTRQLSWWPAWGASRLQRRWIRWGVVAVVATLLVAPAGAQYGDARQGEKILREGKCAMCHSARRSDTTELREKPEALVASMWNHGPILWRAITQRNLTIPDMSEDEMADLYAYYFSRRQFDPPGDATRGQDVFKAKNCYRCHALVPADGGQGPPVSLWPPVSNAVDWVQHMWNHGVEMSDRIGEAGGSWPQFTVQEMVDLLLFIENAPESGPLAPMIGLGDPLAGRGIFREKGCFLCHTVGEDHPPKINLLGAAGEERTPTGLAVRMWNHQPAMMPVMAPWAEMKPFYGEDMPDLVAYLLAEGYFVQSGDEQRGQELFETKSCMRCHGRPDNDAPRLSDGGRRFAAPRLGAVLWRHGAGMREEMLELGIEWPELSDRDVADLIAFMARPARQAD